MKGAIATLYIDVIAKQGMPQDAIQTLKEAIHLQKQQTIAIHWAVLKSFSESSQNKSPTYEYQINCAV